MSITEIMLFTLPVEWRINPLVTRSLATSYSKGFWVGHQGALASLKQIFKSHKKYLFKVATSFKRYRHLKHPVHSLVGVLTSPKER